MSTFKSTKTVTYSSTSSSSSYSTSHPKNDEINISDTKVFFTHIIQLIYEKDFMELNRLLQYTGKCMEELNEVFYNLRKRNYTINQSQLKIYDIVHSTSVDEAKMKYESLPEIYPNATLTEENCNHEEYEDVLKNNNYRNIDNMCTLCKLFIFCRKYNMFKDSSVEATVLIKENLFDLVHSLTNMHLLKVMLNRILLEGTSNAKYDFLSLFQIYEKLITIDSATFKNQYAILRTEFNALIAAENVSTQGVNAAYNLNLDIQNELDEHIKNNRSNIYLHFTANQSSLYLVNNCEVVKTIDKIIKYQIQTKTNTLKDLFELYIKSMNRSELYSKFYDEVLNSFEHLDEAKLSKIQNNHFKLYTALKSYSERNSAIAKQLEYGSTSKSKKHSNFDVKMLKDITPEKFSDILLSENDKLKAFKSIISNNYRQLYPCLEICMPANKNFSLFYKLFINAVRNGNPQHEIEMHFIRLHDLENTEISTNILSKNKHYIERIIKEFQKNGINVTEETIDLLAEPEIFTNFEFKQDVIQSYVLLIEKILELAESKRQTYKKSKKLIKYLANKLSFFTKNYSIEAFYKIKLMMLSNKTKKYPKIDADILYKQTFSYYLTIEEYKKDPKNTMLIEELIKKLKYQDIDEDSIHYLKYRQIDQLLGINPRSLFILFAAIKEYSTMNPDIKHLTEEEYVYICSILRNRIIKFENTVDNKVLYSYIYKNFLPERIQEKFRDMKDTSTIDKEIEDIVDNYTSDSLKRSRRINEEIQRDFEDSISNMQETENTIHQLLSLKDEDKKIEDIVHNNMREYIQSINSEQIKPNMHVFEKREKFTKTLDLTTTYTMEYMRVKNQIYQNRIQKDLDKLHYLHLIQMQNQMKILSINEIIDKKDQADQRTVLVAKLSQQTMVSEAIQFGDNIEKSIREKESMNHAKISEFQQAQIELRDAMEKKLTDNIKNKCKEDTQNEVTKIKFEYVELISQTTAKYETDQKMKNSKIKELEQERDAFIDQIETMNTTHSRELEDLIAANNKKLRDLKTIKDNEITQLNEIKTRLEEDIRKCSQDLSCKETEVQNLKNQIIEYQAVEKLNIEQMKKYDEKITTLVEKLKSTEEIFELKKQETENLRETLNKTKQNFDQVTEAYNILEEKYTNLEREYIDFKHQKEMEIAGLQSKIIEEHKKFVKLELDSNAKSEEDMKRIKSLKDEILMLSSEKENLNVIIIDLRNQIDTHTDTIERMENEIEEYKRLLRQKDEIISKLENNLSTVQSERNSLKNECEAIKKENSDLKKKKSELEKENTRITNEYETRISELTTRYDASVIEIRQLQDQLKQKTGELDEMSEDNENLRAEILLLRKQLNDSTSEVSRLTTEMKNIKEAHRQEKQGLENRIIELETELADKLQWYDKQIKIKEDEKNREIENLKTEQERQRQEYKGKINGLQTDIDNKIRDISSLNVTITTLRGVEQKNAQLNGIIKNMEENLTNLKQEKKTLEDSKSRLEEQNQELNEEIERMTKNHAKEKEAWNKEKDNFTKRIEEQDRELESLRTINTNLRSKITVLEQEVHSLKSQLLSLQQENEILKQENSDLKATIEREREQHAREIEKLKRDIETEKTNALAKKERELNEHWKVKLENLETVIRDEARRQSEKDHAKFDKQCRMIETEWQSRMSAAEREFNERYQTDIEKLKIGFKSQQEALKKIIISLQEELQRCQNSDEEKRLKLERCEKDLRALEAQYKEAREKIQTAMRALSGGKEIADLNLNFDFTLYQARDTDESKRFAADQLIKLQQIKEGEEGEVYITKTITTNYKPVYVPTKPSLPQTNRTITKTTISYNINQSTMIPGLDMDKLERSEEYLIINNVKHYIYIIKNFDNLDEYSIYNIDNRSLFLIIDGGIYKLFWLNENKYYYTINGNQIDGMICTNFDFMRNKSRSFYDAKRRLAYRLYLGSDGNQYAVNGNRMYLIQNDGTNVFIIVDGAQVVLYDELQRIDFIFKVPYNGRKYDFVYDSERSFRRIPDQRFYNTDSANAGFITDFGIFIGCVNNKEYILESGYTDEEIIIAHRNYDPEDSKLNRHVTIEQTRIDEGFEFVRLTVLVTPYSLYKTDELDGEKYCEDLEPGVDGSKNIYGVTTNHSGQHFIKINTSESYPLTAEKTHHQYTDKNNKLCKVSKFLYSIKPATHCIDANGRQILIVYFISMQNMIVALLDGQVIHIEGNDQSGWSYCDVNGRRTNITRFMSLNLQGKGHLLNETHGSSSSTKTKTIKSTHSSNMSGGGFGGSGSVLGVYTMNNTSYGGSGFGGFGGGSGSRFYQTTTRTVLGGGHPGSSSHSSSHSSSSHGSSSHSSSSHSSSSHRKH